MAIHSTNTHSPIAKLRIFSGKISASISHTSGPIVPCIENTNSTTNTRMKYALACPSGSSNADSPTSRWKNVVSVKPPSSILRRSIRFMTSRPTVMPRTLNRPLSVFAMIAAEAEKPDWVSSWVP